MVNGALACERKFQPLTARAVSWRISKSRTGECQNAAFSAEILKGEYLFEMGEYLVDVKNERLSFFTPAGEVKALNDVSIRLKEGEVLGIVG